MGAPHRSMRRDQSLASLAVDGILERCANAASNLRRPDRRRPAQVGRGVRGVIHGQVAVATLASHQGV